MEKLAEFPPDIDSLENLLNSSDVLNTLNEAFDGLEKKTRATGRKLILGSGHHFDHEAGKMLDKIVMILGTRVLAVGKRG